MNRKELNLLAAQTGFVTRDNVAYGTYKSFQYVVYSGNILFIQTDATSSTPVDLKEYRKECRQNKINNIMISGSTIRVLVTSALSAKKRARNLLMALDWIDEFLKTNGFRNCCCICGRHVDTGIYMFADGPHFICYDHVDDAVDKSNRDKQDYEEIDENVAGGIVGALLGALVGGATIVLFGQLGYVTVASGLIMGGATVYGYRKLAHKFSVNGVIVSAVLIILVTYIAVRVNWAIIICKNLYWSFSDAFFKGTEALKAVDAYSYYVQDLVMSYIFCGVAALVSIFTVFSGEKKQFDIATLQDAPQLPEEHLEDITE